MPSAWPMPRCSFAMSKGGSPFRICGTLLDDGGAPAGKLTGTGLAQLIPLEGVTLELGVEAVDLRTLARDLAELPTLPRGLFSGQVRLVQPDLRTAGRLENWSAEGTLEVAGFALESDRMWDLEIETLRYRDGLLRAEGMTARQRLPEPRETVGAIVGTAEAQLIPAGEVRLEATAREVILTHALA